MGDFVKTIFQFQSTPPCGGDPNATYTARITYYFNPRPLAGATASGINTQVAKLISIHAPLRGRPKRDLHSPYNLLFQSTPPCGGDGLGPVQKTADGENFNPRPLAGATDISSTFDTGAGFQSTPPCGGDQCQHRREGRRQISIHAPLRGRLFMLSPHAYIIPYFNPRPLAGATDVNGAANILRKNFNPRPLAGATFTK